MAGPSRYDVSDKEAGIENGILKNKLGIKDQKALDDAETLLLADAYTHFFGLLSKGKVIFDLSLLFSIHEYFLATLYDWAGKTRTINISKDGVLFAPVQHLPSSLKVLEKVLKDNLPTEKDSRRRIAEKLAVIHNDINAVHPFREGNGRTIRLFLDLMVEELGLHPVDWNVKKYMDECRKGMTGDYSGMTAIIHRGISRKK